jgi:hypothetical protein
MYLHYQVKKAYQDQVLRTAARDRLTTQAREGTPPAAPSHRRAARGVPARP